MAGAFRKAGASPLGIDRSNQVNKALKCARTCSQLRYELRRTVLRLFTNRLPKNLRACIGHTKPHGLLC
jgi:hypothetical protein